MRFVVKISMSSKLLMTINDKKLIIKPKLLAKIVIACVKYSSCIGNHTVAILDGIDDKKIWNNAQKHWTSKMRAKFWIRTPIYLSHDVITSPTDPYSATLCNDCGYGCKKERRINVFPFSGCILQNFLFFWAQFSLWINKCVVCILCGCCKFLSVV